LWNKCEDGDIAARTVGRQRKSRGHAAPGPRCPLRWCRMAKSSNPTGLFEVDEGMHVGVIENIFRLTAGRPGFTLVRVGVAEQGPRAVGPARFGSLSDR